MIFAAQLLHRFDIFEKPITLTFKGKQTYSTKFGGFVGLLLYAVIIGFTITRI